VLFDCRKDKVQLKGKRDIQRAQKSLQQEKGVDAAACVDGKIMLHWLPSEHHRLFLVAKLLLRDVTDASLV
jgi:hypothetical protein